MHVLIINFEMDPDSKVLAWQLLVALQISKLCEEVVVLTNRASDFPRPANMHVYIFPNILIRAPLRMIGGKWWINAWVWWLCKKHSINSCFIHMNIEWSYRLWPVFRLLGIPVLLWYAHGTVTDKLRRAHHYATHVVTSTPEGFRVPSNKLSIIGQGIDTSIFYIQDKIDECSSIITVGRISPRKRIDLMVEVMLALLELEPSVKFQLIVIGEPLTAEDRTYFQKIADRIAQLNLSDQVLLTGHVPLTNIPAYYFSAFVHLNLSLTGSMDKTVMESLASGCPILTSNEAFRDVLKTFPQFLVGDEDPKAIAEQVLELYRERHLINRQALREIVLGKHDLTSYAQRIVDEIKRLE